MEHFNSKSLKKKQNKEDLFDAERGDEYIETIIVKGHMVNVFMNDPGQCYWLQWQEDNILRSEGCGTYNWDYKGYAELFLFKGE